VLVVVGGGAAERDASRGEAGHGRSPLLAAADVGAPGIALGAPAAALFGLLLAPLLGVDLPRGRVEPGPVEWHGRGPPLQSSRCSILPARHRSADRPGCRVAVHQASPPQVVPTVTSTSTGMGSISGAIPSSIACRSQAPTGSACPSPHSTTISS